MFRNGCITINGLLGTLQRKRPCIPPCSSDPLLPLRSPEMELPSPRACNGHEGVTCYYTVVVWLSLLLRVVESSQQLILSPSLAASILHLSRQVVMPQAILRNGPHKQRPLGRELEPDQPEHLNLASHAAAPQRHEHRVLRFPPSGALPKCGLPAAATTAMSMHELSALALCRTGEALAPGLLCSLKTPCLAFWPASH